MNIKIFGIYFLFLALLGCITSPLSLRADEGLLIVKVYDTENRPLQGAWVVVQDPSIGDIDATTTDANGEYSIGLRPSSGIATTMNPDGDYILSVGKLPQFESQVINPVQIKVGETTTINVKLGVVSRNIKIIVKEQVTDIPIGGALIVLTSDSSPFTPQYVTGKAGIIEIPSIPAGTWKMQLTANGYFQVTDTAINVGYDQPNPIIKTYAMQKTPSILSQFETTTQPGTPTAEATSKIPDWVFFGIIIVLVFYGIMKK